jgi:hypothetical protein
MIEEAGAALNRYVSATICAVSDARGMIIYCPVSTSASCRRPLPSFSPLVMGGALPSIPISKAFPMLCSSLSHADLSVFGFSLSACAHHPEFLCTHLVPLCCLCLRWSMRLSRNVMVRKREQRQCPAACLPWGRATGSNSGVRRVPDRLSDTWLINF